MQYLVEEGKRAKYHNVCDFCDKVIGSSMGDKNDVTTPMPITVHFPFGHSKDTMSHGHEFCSDGCVIKFLQKSIEEHGEYNVSTDVEPLVDLKEERKGYDY
jgi:hypothetical protein